MRAGAQRRAPLAIAAPPPARPRPPAVVSTLRSPPLAAGHPGDLAAMPLEQEAAATLRSVVHDCLAKHMYDAAAFFADKLLTFTAGAPAEAFYCNRQFRRCLQLLRASELVEKDMRFRYLAARCLAECREWEECLGLLGGLEAEGPEQLGLAMPRAAPGTISYLSAVCLLRGRAFQLLVGNHKLSGGEELALVASLDIPPTHAWLRALYTAKKYEQAAAIDRALEELENLPPNSQQQQQQQQQAAVTPPADGALPAATPPPGRQLPATPAARQAAQQRQQQQVAPGSGPEPMSMTPAPSGSAEMDGAAAAAAGGGGGAARLPGGWGLGDNLDVIACRADWLYQRGAYAECYALTSAALEHDPYAAECLPAHLAAALELRKKNELFVRGHRLVEEYPEKAVSWFAARRTFGKATALDRAFAPAWVAFGHAFAAQDESDQARGGVLAVVCGGAESSGEGWWWWEAMAAYRTAARLFPGLHAPLLGMGMEYLRMNNLGLAETCFAQAAKLCPSDPAVAHELGALAYRSHHYERAAHWLARALEMAAAGGGRLTQATEPTLVALGHTYRKLRRWADAAACYGRALGLAPGQPGTYAALGYTHHLAGELDAAIQNYHKVQGGGGGLIVVVAVGLAGAEEAMEALPLARVPAAVPCAHHKPAAATSSPAPQALGLRPEDAFTAEMLAAAMEESSTAFLRSVDA
eukprot:scaffold10.g2438.t1